MKVSIKEKYEKLDISTGQLNYAKRMQWLLCRRLDVNLPKELEISEIVAEQALYIYIDTLERYYRLDEKEWGKFYTRYHGLTIAPNQLEGIETRKNNRRRRLRNRKN